MLGFFFKADDAIRRIDGCDSKASRFLGRDLNGCNGDVGFLLTVPIRHFRVIHFVNMISGKYKYKVGRLCLNRFDVLIDSVCRAQVPVVVHALHGRHCFDELADLTREDGPAVADVAGEFELLYCVRTKMRRSPEFRQLESVKSMIR